MIEGEDEFSQGFAIGFMTGILVAVVLTVGVMILKNM